jgi:hypothetical protein
MYHCMPDVSAAAGGMHFEGACHAVVTQHATLPLPAAAEHKEGLPACCGVAVPCLGTFMVHRTASPLQLAAGWVLHELKREMHCILNE